MSSAWNHDDFRRMYESCAPAVKRRAQRLLGSEPQAWDALQEVFTRVFHAHQAFTHVERPLAYLYRVTTHVCLNQLRARASRSRAETSAEALRPASSQASVGQVEARADLEKLAVGLSEREASIALLHFVEGIPQGEVAEILGLSRKTVVRAVDKLRSSHASLSPGGAHALE